MATINPYLQFDGNCDQAMTFYKECLGGKLTFMRIRDTPMANDMPAENQSKIMHANLSADGITILASDRMDSAALVRGNDVYLMLYCSSEEEIRTLFPKLSAGGSNKTELKEEFWGAIYGDFIDKFEVRWMMNWDKPE